MAPTNYSKQVLHNQVHCSRVTALLSPKRFVQLDTVQEAFAVSLDND